MKVRLAIVVLGVALGLAAKWVVGVVKTAPGSPAATQAEDK